MLLKTRGIILKNIKYSETSLVVKVFTEEIGLQSYIVNGVRSPKAKIKASQLQPLNLLDMVVYHKDSKSLQRVSEIKSNYIYSALPFDIAKCSIGIFLLEIIQKSIQEQEANKEMFCFIFNCLKFLDTHPGNVANFHLYFMLHFTKHLGFFPGGIWSEDTPVFNLKEGIFEPSGYGNNYALSESDSKVTSLFLHSGHEDFDRVLINSSVRKRLLGNYIKYYSWHVENFTATHSNVILEEVLG